MPIYEYECDGCHTVFEVRQKVSDPAPTQHSCGSSEVRRILSATSFVLKGTGWYATDYGNRSKAPKEAAGSPAQAAPEAAKADATAKPKAAPAASGAPAESSAKTSTS